MIDVYRNPMGYKYPIRGTFHGGTMPKQSKCYRCNAILTKADYDPRQDALICYNCAYPDPDNPDVTKPTLNILEPEDYRDMGIRRN